MGEIYTEAAAYNMTIVGSADPNVGLGGYLTGGGHSPVSSKYGLGADNVLQVVVVTPDGNVVISNECQNSDLFWAIKGVGLGPDLTSAFFGTATFTIKLY